MPRQLKQSVKYKCLEVMCNTVHRQDKWQEHCRKKHAYKFKNNLKINYRVVEVKTGDGPWQKVKETTASSSSSNSQHGHLFFESSRYVDYEYLINFTVFLVF